MMNTNTHAWLPPHIVLLFFVMHFPSCMYQLHNVDGCEFSHVKNEMKWCLSQFTKSMIVQGQSERESMSSKIHKKQWVPEGRSHLYHPKTISTHQLMCTTQAFKFFPTTIFSPTMKMLKCSYALAHRPKSKAQSLTSSTQRAHIVCAIEPVNGEGQSGQWQEGQIDV